MENTTPLMLFALVFAFFVVLIIVSKILVNVGAKEIAIKERRYFGAKMPPGRVVPPPWLRFPPWEVRLDAAAGRKLP